MYDLVVSFLGEPHSTETVYEEDRQFQWFWIPMSRVLELKQLLQSDFSPTGCVSPYTLGFNFYGEACHYEPNRNDPSFCTVVYSE